MPKVSVIIPSYNHEKFVSETISSVLSQTFQDFEIIVVDDGSGDRTADVVRSHKDPRIKLTALGKNGGASAAVNICIGESSGEYIAMLSSDDVFLPDKLEKQVRFLDNNPSVAAVFTEAGVIDETGAEIPEHHCRYLFEQANRSRHEWLNHFFYKGNCLCHPSLLIRREHYRNFNERLAGIPDLDMWIRLCLGGHEIHILPEKLVKFRIMSDKSNAAGHTLPNDIRYRFESKQVLDNYLAVSTADELIKVFPGAKKYGTVEDGLVPYFLARLALDTEVDYKQLWGLEKLYDFMGDEYRVRLLRDKTGFGYPDLYKLVSSRDVFKVCGAPSRRSPLSLYLFKKTGLNNIEIFFRKKLRDPVRALLAKNTVK